MEDSCIKSYWSERWLPVCFRKDTCKTEYEISNYGRIKSIHRASGKARLIKGSTIERGFRVLNVRLEDGSRDAVMVHRFVARNFVPRSSEDYIYVIHIDGDNGNNYWKNLQWLTHEEWVAYMLNTPKRKAAEKNRKRKLSESQVKMIKRMLSRGKIKVNVIARQFNISVTHVKRIQKGENWGDIEPD
ncbi:MAG: NUMOD4 domain-containing protein [Bacteroidota bacterium]